jgi:hypothetical protein
MIRQSNPELAKQMLDHLTSQYKILEVREPNHLSTFVSCLTKGFLDQKQAVDPTEEEIMLFVLGYGLQDVLTPKDATTPIYNRDGIVYRPDFFLPNINCKLNEIKTTRKSSKKHEEDIPETWLTYMMGGCFITDETKYNLIVLYLMGGYSPPFPQAPLCDTFTFEIEELVDNWHNILHRKYILDTALKENKLPTPFEYCYSWECKYCRYRMICEAIGGKKDD